MGCHWHDLVALALEKRPGSHLREAGWAPGPIWMGSENLIPTMVQSTDSAVHSKSLDYVNIENLHIYGNIECMLMGKLFEKRHFTSALYAWNIVLFLFSYFCVATEKKHASSLSIIIIPVVRLFC
jgi:hypothetical protein